MNGQTGGDEAQAPSPTLCDFCGQVTMKVGPMVEGNALIQGGLKNQKAHICADCVKACEGIPYETLFPVSAVTIVKF